MKNAILYFFFFPFLGFLNAIKNYRSSWAKPTLIGFVAFFGMSMIKSEQVDSSRYVTNLQNMYTKSQSFDSIQNSFYNDEDGQLDIYIPIVTYVFSLFTDNGKLFFLFLGLIYGYFYINNIWLVLKQSVGRLSWIHCLFLLTFSFDIGFWEINGVRMWTAAHVFFYGGFLYLYHNNKKGLLIASIAILIHFSFALPVLLLLIYGLFRLNYRYLYFIYIASFFILELNIELIRVILENYLPDFIFPKVKTYLGEQYLEQLDENIIFANWYILYFQKFLSYFTIIFISVLFFLKDIPKSTRKLFGFSLLFLAVANITSLLPSGGRFLNVAFLFSMAFSFILLVNTKNSIVKKSAYLLSPLLILFCIISIRTSFDFFNITTLTNPFVVLFTDIDISLIELIK